MAIDTRRSKNVLDQTLDRAVRGIDLTRREISHLLALDDYSDIVKVMTAAQYVRKQYFDNKIFIYGFVYFSTYCRNHCNFCFYRSSNTKSPRYRKTKEEILEISEELATAGVHLIDLTMGEDPRIHEGGNFEELLEIVNNVKDKTGLPIMVSPGVIPDSVIKDLSKSADWYALYQESYNVNLYKKLRFGQSFNERINKRRTASQQGMLVEDGILLGVGESNEDRLEAILKMKNSEVNQVRVMSFVAQEQTPMEKMVSPPRYNEYLTIAVMRLIMPNRLIPASLDVDGIKGLQKRLEAGANVVTSVIPPSHSLAGVSSSELDIDQGLRTPVEVKRILEGMDLEIADPKFYREWVEREKNMVFLKVL